MKIVVALTIFSIFSIDREQQVDFFGMFLVLN